MGGSPLHEGLIGQKGDHEEVAHFEDEAPFESTTTERRIKGVIRCQLP